MCNAYSITYKCGHVQYAQGLPCGRPDCSAPSRQIPCHQICLDCTDYEYMGLRFSNKNQRCSNMDEPAAVNALAPPFEDYMCEPSFDVEMVDPAIYSDMLGIQDDIISFSPLEEPIDALTGRSALSPPQLQNTIEFIQLEAPVRSHYMYPSPINYFAGWDPLEQQTHTHPGYGDYVTSLDEADIHCPFAAPAPTSASTCSDNNDTVTEQTTPSPSFFSRSCNEMSLSPGTPEDRLFLTRCLTSRELSPTPGARGHETFVEAASAILDLPISWRGNGTLREFLDEEDEDGYLPDDEEDEEEEIDYTTPQPTKMRQPDFHRSDYQVFPDLGGPKISLGSASASDNSNLGALDQPMADDTATTDIVDTTATKTAPPTSAAAAAAAAEKSVKGVDPDTKTIGPFSLAPTAEVGPSNI
ncbi:hypothetical protein MGYG_07236 [Nannizzia gypsea CBS 118893]|uniref:Uncharacterized protein n=1 Tax=Arthroderma gypseum (strain ATCC MYA-4604 / CBS 118893) TaxID=535722 RepID=E4V2G4_ARTGP|nr:hypothetical protein MGYG_07236 [Nannizzia gypsea CBS 118893]EFR04229.1 hypothetical protein MGYG_07236 [Nannizzia gypsea CBS 118893]